MAKRPYRLQVEVRLATESETPQRWQRYSTGQFADQAWCTSVDITRKGELQLWEGHRIRVFHPAGEWLEYKVTPITATRHQVEGDIAREAAHRKQQRDRDLLIDDDRPTK